MKLPQFKLKPTEIFIGSKKIDLLGKTPAQLEHLLQLAKDEVVRYAHIIENYPLDRLEKHALPFKARLQDTVHKIEAALKVS